jgi:hypothetical protein
MWKHQYLMSSYSGVPWNKRKKHPHLYNRETGAKLEEWHLWFVCVCVCVCIHVRAHAWTGVWIQGQVLDQLSYASSPFCLVVYFSDRASHFCLGQLGKKILPLSLSWNYRCMPFGLFFFFFFGNRISSPPYPGLEPRPSYLCLRSSWNYRHVPSCPATVSLLTL